jgi:amino acid adenylation domain-containing protein
MPKQDHLLQQLIALSPAKRALLEHEIAKRKRHAPGGTTIQRRGNNGHPPLSFAQQRLWFLNQLDPESLTFIEPKAFRFNGRLNIRALRQALREIVRRHEALRTTFVSHDGQVEQCIAEESNVEISVFDLSTSPEAVREAKAQSLLNQIVRRRFDLSHDQMLRATLIRRDECDHILLLLTHHIVSDGWSLGILSREIGLLYDAFAAGRSSPLPELPIQYADYAIWERQWLSGEETERQLSYWRAQLRAAPVLELPTDAPRPVEQTFDSAQHFFTLPAQLTARLMDFNRRQSVTPFMTLLAVFQVLLCRYSGQEDVILGTPIANRQRVELENLIGLLLNTLVLRGDLSGEPSFAEVVRRVRRSALDAYQHQDLPFEKLVEELRPERDLSRHPLFQVMFVLQNAPAHPLRLTGLEVSHYPVSTNSSALDLEVHFSAEADTYRGLLFYNTALFSAARIQRMAGHYQMLLEGVLNDPERSVFAVEMLTASERHQLLVEWNDTGLNYGRNECIHHLFEEQVEKRPAAVAVAFRDKLLTYGELNERANRLSEHLRQLGVHRGTRVGICVEPSFEMVIGLIAILKSGAAYVPLDHHFPARRLALIWQDAEARVVLVQEELRSLCADFPGEVVVLGPSSPCQATDIPRVEVSPNDAAYVIYTSGSTGRPKGMVIEHGGVVNFLKSTRDRLGISREDTLLAITTISFDPSVLEIFLPLSVGARIVIAPDNIRGDGEELAKLLEQSGATILQATPTTWNLLLAASWTAGELKALIGGEALSGDLARRILNRCAELWNLYGPTETTVWSTLGRIERAEEITIGRPIANKKVYVVDRHTQPVPVGVTGELFIGGSGLARHYLSLPEMTAERFVANPFSSERESRLYRSGDLCRYRADGNLEFLGRMDHQLKIRGFRVELGEIEAAVLEHPAISHCVVIERVDESGDRRLVAYLIERESRSIPSGPALREFLKQKLPDYMVPAVFVKMEKWPLTSSGKIDRKALPEPLISGNDLAACAAFPRDSVERQIARIWEDLLRVRGIGMTDDFFGLGGHSLLAVRLIADVNRSFDIHLPLATIFRAPTIEGLACAVRNIDEVKLKPPGLIAPRTNAAPRKIFWAPSVGALERFVECHNLARLLHGNYDFFGFDPAVELTEIHSLAQHCVRLIRAEQPRGPYSLAGYCQCGHVAHEIAKQLENHGEVIELLAIIDCSARELAPNFRQRIYWLRDGFRGNPLAVAGRLRRAIVRRLPGQNGVAALANPPQENQYSAHGKAAARHKAARLRGAVVLFRGNEFSLKFRHSPTLGWDALARTVHVHRVPSRHSDMLKDAEAVRLIANTLKEYGHVSGPDFDKSEITSRSTHYS